MSLYIYSFICRGQQLFNIEQKNQLLLNRLKIKIIFYNDTIIHIFIETTGKLYSHKRERRLRHFVKYIQLMSTKILVTMVAFEQWVASCGSVL